MTVASAGTVYTLDMRLFDIGSLVLGTSVVRTSTTFSVNLDGEITSFVGFGITYGSDGIPSAGTITQISDTYLGQLVYTASGFSIPATSFLTWAVTADTNSAVSAVFLGADSITGSAGGDYLFGLNGSDTIFGGSGNDTIRGDDGLDYLRGDDGNDSIVGGAGFDDINGNKGNDTAFGGDGGDWVVGGQDNDQLFGENGDDIVYGNLGNDTVSGGDGADWVRGGQGDDVVVGGAGNDWLWGDRGNDTITGGAGADLFHSFSGAGIDRITDFKYAEGDRVILDDRTAYTVTQVGADAVITIGGVDQVVLVGVSASGLSSDAVIYA